MNEKADLEFKVLKKRTSKTEKKLSSTTPILKHGVPPPPKKNVKVHN